WQESVGRFNRDVCREIENNAVVRDAAAAPACAALAGDLGADLRFALRHAGRSALSHAAGCSFAVGGLRAAAQALRLRRSGLRAVLEVALAIAPAQPRLLAR